jgi:formylglycine-generating enzyme
MGIKGSRDMPQINPLEVMRPLQNLPANDYGLYGMCGDVWEWVQDWYDAQYYEDSPQINPTGPENGEQKVLRGGSWADDGEAIIVSFRISLPPSLSLIPNIGFRLCHVVNDSSERT